MLRDVPGTKSVIAERISAGYYVDVQNDLERMARHGVTVDEAMATVRYGIGGDNIIGIRQADNTIVPLSVQYSPEYIDTLDKLRKAPVVTENGRSIPLGDIADVSVRNMPEMIRDDNGKLAGYIYVDLQDVTGPDYVDRARQVLAANLTLPTGYSVEWTGLYQYAAAARARLRTVVPLTLGIIFILLVVAFKSVGETILILLSVPFAMVGGIFLQWMLGYPMTTAVIVGYISLFAVAVQTGIIMVMFIRRALDHRQSDQSYIDAVVDGSASRLRPKLMTVAVTILSLLPVMFASGAGMEIMKPIAAPSIGGMVSSSLHVLFMTPCLFVIGEDVRAGGAAAADGAGRSPPPRDAGRVLSDRASVSAGFDGYVEVRGIHHAVPLKLHPDAESTRAREHQIELHHLTAIGNEGMRVDHVDQVVAGGQHVPPGAQILLEPIRRVQREAHLDRRTGGRLGRIDGEIDGQVFCLFLRIVARQRDDGAVSCPSTKTVLGSSCGVAASG